MKEIQKYTITLEEKKQQLLDVLYIRCLAVISLVAWHSYCSYICWGYGNSPLDVFYTKLFSYLTPDANMPLFTFLAGYLFCFLLKEKKKYPTFKGFLNNKVHRLLIPFLVLGVLTNLTEYNRSLIEMFYGKPSHLWYCLMLFYCYIVCWVVEHYGGQKWNIGLTIISCMVVLVKGLGGLGPNIPFGLFLPIYYYCYFYIGFLVFEHRDKFLRLLNKFCSVIILFYMVLSWFSKSHLILFQCLSYIFVVLWLFNIILEKAKNITPPYLLKNTIINSISKCSMGIYVFHQWIIWNITRPDFFHDIIHEHYILFPLICWVLIFMISWGLSHLLIKYTKVGKFLLT